MTPYLLPRPASFCKDQSLTVGRSAKQAGFLKRLGSRRLGRISRASSRASIALAFRRRLSAEIMLSCFSTMSYWGGLSSPPSHSRTLDSIGSFAMVDV